MNRYTNRERAAVKSVVVDLNAQYIKFIKELFPNARIIIDRIIDEAVELESRVARLPENLCFDGFRSVNSTMSFICCDAEGMTSWLFLKTD